MHFLLQSTTDKVIESIKQNIMPVKDYLNVKGYTHVWDHQLMPSDLIQQID